MRFFEELQYKARNFLYEKEREKKHKQQSNHNNSYYSKSNSSEDSVVKKLLDSMDEIDTYLEEKVDEWNLKIKK